MPGGYGVTSSALTRPAASRGLTASVAAKNASRGSIACSVRSSLRLGSAGPPCPRPVRPSHRPGRARTPQPVALLLAVREGDQRHDPPVVDEFDVDLALVAQPVVGFVARQAHG